MSYVKNLPAWERALRVVVGAAAAAWGMLALGGTAGTVLALSAAGIACSGLLGFCPACAMVGRKLDNSRKTHGTR